LMVTGKMNEVSGDLSGLSPAPAEQEEGKRAEHGDAASDIPSETRPGGAKPSGTKSAGTEESETKSEGTKRAETEQKDIENESISEAESESSENTMPPAIDFRLQDQYGNTHTLEDYKGKTIFLNFWATWCPPCRAEMPDIQKLHEEYSQEGEEALIVLGVAAPGMGQEQDEEGIRAFLEENGYTYPVLMDTEGDLFYSYGIRAFPTTFMIDRDGNVFGYISGQLTMEMMESIIRQTMEGKRQ